MTEREKLLGRVRMYDFALVDAIEYLDGHPEAFGPLTAREVDTRVGRWRWIDDPWPWEGEDN